MGFRAVRRRLGRGCTLRARRLHPRRPFRRCENLAEWHLRRRHDPAQRRRQDGDGDPEARPERALWPCDAEGSQYPCRPVLVGERRPSPVHGRRTRRWSGTTRKLRRDLGYERRWFQTGHRRWRPGGHRFAVQRQGARGIRLHPDGRYSGGQRHRSAGGGDAVRRGRDSLHLARAHECLHRYAQTARARAGARRLVSYRLQWPGAIRVRTEP